MLSPTTPTFTSYASATSNETGIATKAGAAVGAATTNQEKDFSDDTEVDTSFRKPKKQLSEQKLQHLQNIRVKALEKRKEMKVITEKANN